jgi:uncharacterized membrane-anchored protein
MNDVTKQALSKVPAVTLGFWVIKILATTLGETGGDTVTMTLNWGYLAGVALFGGVLVAAIIVVLIILLPQRPGRHPGEKHGAAAVGGAESAGVIDPEPTDR